MTSRFAVLHRLAAFTLVGALVAEPALIQDGLTPKSARSIPWLISSMASQPAPF
jgi:uncharacterized membrane protein